MDWSRRRSRLNHSSVKNTLILQLIGLKRRLDGEVMSALPLVVLLERAIEEAGTIERELQELLDDLPRSMSPSAVLIESSDGPLAEPVIEHGFLSFLDTLWADSNRIDECVRRARASLESLKTHLVQLNSALGSEAGAGQEGREIVSLCLGDTDALAAAISELPAVAGLCFQS